jgi:hypothetical protein
MSSMQGQELANDRLDVQADEDSEHVRVIFPPTKIVLSVVSSLGRWRFGMGLPAMRSSCRKTGWAGDVLAAPGDHVDRLR